MFAVGVAADRVGVEPGYAFPEEIGCWEGVKFSVAREFKATRQTDHFGNLRVGVSILKFVASFAKRFNDGKIVKTVARFEIFFISGSGVKRVERVVCSAVFAQEHFLHLLEREIFRNVDRPVAKPFSDVEGLLAVAVMISVKETGADFMERVPRNPQTVQIESLGPDIASSDFLKDLEIVGIARKDSGTRRVLALASSDAIYSARSLNRSSPVEA